ncbi:hypothetical protein RI543_003602 [Arxiozyma heterogenica]|uniref:SWIRM domain-containing protein n=2 Tax=Arxiozyma heterogenica TaxID=278026 RepID=A0AAN7WLQ2_9SACH|nr:hypothetical protein RI543_003602 [Kazachstania heterogenica]
MKEKRSSSTFVFTSLPMGKEDQRLISQSDSNLDSVTSNNNNQNQLKRKCFGTDSSEWIKHKFPSPPVSPQKSIKNAIQYAKNRYNGIMVLPIWKKDQTIKIYRYNLKSFLLKYRMFSSNQSIYENESYYNRINSRNINSRHSHYLRNIYYESSVESEGLRKNVLKNSYRNYLNAEEPTIYKKSVSPFWNGKMASTPSPRPSIASMDLIQDVPQYIPNISWKKLPDYSPSIETLPPGNNKCLKVGWKGSPLNLSNDPLKSYLHPAELNLASTLRLPCDLYLDSKRRLFLEKVCKLQNNLPFRRTDAQKACRIDVNKASRLYSAFEKVGWLEDENFLKYLD